MGRQTLTRCEFLDRLAGMRRGESVVYHIGDLLSDRERGIDFLAVDSVAAAAMQACEEGKCHLVQRRVRPGITEYIVVRIDPPRPFKWVGSYDLDRLMIGRKGRRSSPVIGDKWINPKHPTITS